MNDVKTISMMMTHKLSRSKKIEYIGGLKNKKFVLLGYGPNKDIIQSTSYLTSKMSDIIEEFENVRDLELQV